jgi:feruloyl esterase
MLVTPAMTNAYFQALVTKYGTAVPDFVRYFVVPGYGHAAGVFNMTWDSVSALEAWAEKGQAPVGQVTVDSSAANAGRSRPLCEFGSYPKYSGSGDINSAASYTCSPL